MKKIILILSTFLTGITTTIAMEQPAAPKYSQNASLKLMRILIYDARKNVDTKVLNDVKNALNEGANPNYIHCYIEFIPSLNLGGFIRKDKEISKITSPLQESLTLRNEQLLTILLDAGANPDLKNIYITLPPQTAREFAQKNDIVLPQLQKLP